MNTFTLSLLDPKNPPALAGGVRQSVPNGTVAEVLDIWEGFFVGEGQGSDINCYVLKGLPNRLFRGHEIEEVGDE